MLYFTMDNDTKAKSNHNKDKTNVTWSHSDESTVVHTLKKAKENGMWSDNNPKDVAWTSCVTALSGSENVSEGAPKDAKAIKWKWQCVCDNHISCPICMPSCLSLAETRIQYHQEHAQSVWMEVGPWKVCPRGLQWGIWRIHKGEAWALNYNAITITNILPRNAPTRLWQSLSTRKDFLYSMTLQNLWMARMQQGRIPSKLASQHRTLLHQSRPYTNQSLIHDY